MFLLFRYVSTVFFVNRIIIITNGSCVDSDTGQSIFRIDDVSIDSPLNFVRSALLSLCLRGVFARQLAATYLGENNFESSRSSFN